MRMPTQITRSDAAKAAAPCDQVAAHQADTDREAVTSAYRGA